MKKSIRRLQDNIRAILGDDDTIILTPNDNNEEDNDDRDYKKCDSPFDDVDIGEDEDIDDDEDDGEDSQ